MEPAATGSSLAYFLVHECRLSPHSPLGAVAKAAVQLNCCGRCALRFGGCVRKLLYQLPRAVVEEALREVLQLERAVHPEFTCAACAGLLQCFGNLRVLVETRESRAEALHRYAAVSWGVAFGADGKRKGERERVALAAPVTPANDWLWEVARAVASSGYDLRGGVAISISLPTGMVRDDEELQRRSHAAAAQQVPSLGGSVAPWALKPTLRTLITLSLSSMVVEGLPGGAAVTTVPELHRTMAEAAATAGARSSAAPLGGSSSSSSSSPAVFVDLGTGVSGIGSNSALTEWSHADPVDSPLVREVAAALGAWAAEHGDLFPGTSPSAGGPSGGGGVAHLQVSQQASLQLGLLVETPASLQEQGVNAAPRVFGQQPGNQRQLQRQRKQQKRDGAAAAAAGGAAPRAGAGLEADAGAQSSPKLPDASAPEAGAENTDGASSSASSSFAAGIPLADDTSSRFERAARVSLSLQRGPIFVKARYNKFVRGLSQSPWFVDGKRMGAIASSVEEMVGGGVATALWGGEINFSAAAAAIQTVSVKSATVANSNAGAEATASSSSLSTEAVSSTVVVLPALMLPRVLVLPYSVVPHGEPGLANAASSSAPGAASFLLPGSPWALTHPPAVVPAEPLDALCAYKFHAAGREDVDVRMLGNGRPCMVELIDCRGAVVPLSRIAGIAPAVNRASCGLIALLEPMPATKDEFAALSSGADSKQKRYAALCWTSAAHTAEELHAKLGGVRDLQVVQRTPVRVLHRRSLLDRKKMVHDMRTEWLDPHHFTLFLTTSAGAYVKEFVHGDLGRTRPNVGMLLACDADIMQLDVTDLLERPAGSQEGADDSDEE